METSAYPQVPPDGVRPQQPVTNSFNPKIEEVAPTVKEEPKPTSTWTNFKENKYAMIVLGAIAIICIIVLAYFFYKWYEDNKDVPKQPSVNHSIKPQSIQDRIARDTKGYYPPAIKQPTTLESTSVTDIISPGYKSNVPPHPTDVDMSEYVDAVEEEGDTVTLEVIPEEPEEPEETEETEDLNDPEETEETEETEGSEEDVVSSRMGKGRPKPKN
jgi:hypothetical protein